MILSDMLQRIRDEIRDDAIDTKIVGWLSDAQTEIANSYVFDSLDMYANVNSTASAPDITLASDFLWMKSIVIPAFRREVYPGDVRMIKKVTPDYRTRIGFTQWYYMRGINTIGTYLVSAAILTFSYNYQQRPTLFVPSSYTGNETSGFPIEWDALLIQKAKTFGYFREGNSEAAGTSKGLELSIQKSINANAHRRLDNPIVFGSGQARGNMKPPYPSFPAHYPRLF